MLVTLRFMRGRWLLLVRRLHLYLSVFFAPLLLLFVVTGWAQTTGLAHSSSLMARLSEVHKDQYYPASEADTDNKKHFFLGGKTGRNTSTVLVKRLVAMMCAALIISIALGMVLAFTTMRSRIPVWISLILGIATPVLLLALAHVKPPSHAQAPVTQH